MPLTIQDLQHFQEDHPDYRLELVDGEIIVMSPSGFESNEVAAEIIRQLGNWVRPRRLGRVLASSAGYILPNANEDVRAPDASFIRADRLKRTTSEFAQLVPDLMFEVASKSDRPEKLRIKIRTFLELGTQVGILVDPRIHALEVHHAEQEAIVLRDGDVLALPELLPEWEMEVSSIWAPEFD
ncbi:MAG: Uma2 family endonuclease [Drouetiella hepatica Uher 2000/2452]|jgi:Uma2 family endonuclease|uniref:Uma2 family endonuclease n=1 Tax=Drouetiella hepatica Uher 2000/2452 TaxID=904376 RepID=A0A951Q941_9CYAN|nr:Uma2 family endonuclease [Drouetiella hepatica Uher 2000/2452]